jgi:CIC family chloride channel protein
VILIAPAIGGLLVGLILQYLLTARRTGAARLPVVAPADRGRIVGWASKVRALAAYNRELIASSVEEHR